jgi:Holliday junction resolvasome RuvABC endonuclease subunit
MEFVQTQSVQRKLRIMKIKITELENRLNYKIKRNFKVIGFDTASTAGIAFAKTDEEYIYLDWCYFSFEKKSEEDLLTQMYKEFGKVITDENFAVVEQVFLGFSRAGSLILAKMGTIAVAQCIAHNVPFKLISAVSARSKFKIDARKYGKGKSKLAVKDWMQNTAKIDIIEDNCVDALVLAFCGICEAFNFEPVSVSKKRIKKVAVITKKKISKRKKK